MKNNKNDTETEFLKSYNSEINRHQKELDSFIQNAADKDFALKEHSNLFYADFVKDQNAFPDLIPFLLKIDKEIKLDKNKTFYSVIENSFEFQSKDRIFLVALAVMKAKYDFIDRLQASNQNDVANENINDIDTNLKFEWSKNLTQRDFAKLFYALKEAGFLKGEITKIVPQAAKVLNFDLGSSWEANFSKGKRYSNANFSHVQLFDTLKEAFTNYYDQQLNEQMKRSK